MEGAMAKRDTAVSSRGKYIWTAVLAFGCLQCTGCSVVRTVKHSFALQAAYHEPADSLLVGVRHCLMARKALEKFEELNPGIDLSRHFKKGFRSGFHDVLHGGDGKPPVLPPPKYWTVFYRDAEGHQAIQEWFAGFEVGAQWAIDHGYRRWELIPTYDDQEVRPAKLNHLAQPKKTTSSTETPETGKTSWQELLRQEQKLAKLTAQWLRSQQEGVSPAVHESKVNASRPRGSEVKQVSASSKPAKAVTSSHKGPEESAALLFLPVPLASDEPQEVQDRPDRTGDSSLQSATPRPDLRPEMRRPRWRRAQRLEVDFPSAFSVQQKNDSEGDNSARPK
jgi:hypothetical protein